MSAAPARRARRILFGLGYGALAGWIAREALGGTELLEHAIAWVAYPIGQIFLRMLFMAVLPLVVSSLALGVLELGDVRRLGRVGALTLGYALAVSAGSVAIGIGLVNYLRPGDGFDPAARERLIETLAPQAQKVVTQAEAASGPIDALISIIPRNPFEALVRAFDGEMLGVMFFAVMLGIALVTTPRERTTGLVSALEGLYAISLRLIDMAMSLAPYGVFALMFSLTARLGGDMLITLGRYVGVVLLGLALQQFGVYSLLVRYAIGIQPRVFFARISEVMTTAFSTSSSAATLPTALRVGEQRLGIPREINSFVLTVGATANQNGTALFEGITVLFLAQLFGVDLSLGQQAMVVLLSILAGVGTAGVPGGSLPLIVVVLQTVGVPGEGIAVILGVDRLLDMSRTVLNVTGDLTAALFVTRVEGKLALPRE